jgi:hypothetical protein
MFTPHWTPCWSSHICNVLTSILTPFLLCNYELKIFFLQNCTKRQCKLCCIYAPWNLRAILYLQLTFKMRGMGYSKRLLTSIPRGQSSIQCYTFFSVKHFLKMKKRNAKNGIKVLFIGLPLHSVVRSLCLEIVQWPFMELTYFLEYSRCSTCVSCLFFESLAHVFGYSTNQTQSLSPIYLCNRS